MAKIIDLRQVIDVLISQSGADEIRISRAEAEPGNVTVDFIYKRLINKRTGEEIAPGGVILATLDIGQKIDHRNPYYEHIANEVRYERDRYVKARVTASMEPAPGADHQPLQPAPQTDPTA